MVTVTKNHLIIFCILVLGLVLRCVDLNQSFWLDEASQAQMSALSVGQIWFERTADFHPPLFYVLAHFWQALGTSEVFLRLLPVFFGWLTIVVIYKFGKIFNEKIALVSALFMAINPFAVYYSQEYRSYSLLMFLTCVSMYLVVHKKYWQTSVVNALILYTHYSGVLFVGVQLLLFPKLWTWVWITIVAYLPWVPQFIAQFRGGVNIDQYLPGWRQILTISPLKALPLITFKLAAGRINFVNKYFYALYMAFVLVVFVLSGLAANLQRKLLLTWYFGPLVLSLLLSFVIPQTQPFRLIYILPALILLFAQASVRFPKIIFPMVLYILIAGNVMYFTRPRLQREQWRQAIQFVNKRPEPTVIAFTGKFAPMIWYQSQFRVVPALSKFPAQPADVAANLSLANLPSRIYYFEYLSGLTDPEKIVPKTLQDLGYNAVATHDFSGVGFVFEYQKHVD